MSVMYSFTNLLYGDSLSAKKEELWVWLKEWMTMVRKDLTD